MPRWQALLVGDAHQATLAPNLAGESEMYLQAQLKAFRSSKRTHEIMSVVAKQLSDDDIANLAAS